MTAIKDTRRDKSLGEAALTSMKQCFDVLDLRTPKKALYWSWLLPYLILLQQARKLFFMSFRRMALVSMRGISVFMDFD